MSSARARPFAVLDRFLASEWLYDPLMRLLGFRASMKPLVDALGDTGGRLVLDVGGGTGNLALLLAPGTRYVCVDNDEAKLARLRSKLPAARAVLGDATQLPFADASVDDAVCVAVTHHLSDDGVRDLARELGRVARERVFILDALNDPAFLRGRLLWKIDRGSHPRTESELIALVEPTLRRRRVVRYAVHHRYWLWIGEPAAAAAD